MESNLIGNRTIYCPLCGSGIPDNSGSEEHNGFIHTFFLCEHKSHYAPYSIAELIPIDALRNRNVAVSSSTDQVVM